MESAFLKLKQIKGSHSSVNKKKQALKTPLLMLLFRRRITLLPILINKKMLPLLTKEDKEMAFLTIVL